MLPNPIHFHFNKFNASYCTCHEIYIGKVYLLPSGARSRVLTSRSFPPFLSTNPTSQSHLSFQSTLPHIKMQHISPPPSTTCPLAFHTYPRSSTSTSQMQKRCKPQSRKAAHRSAHPFYPRGCVYQTAVHRYHGPGFRAEEYGL